MSNIQLVVGLGNPGTRYAETRHNIGAHCVERFAQQLHSDLKLNTKFSSRVAQASLGQQAFWLQCPTTYMNESGQAVGQIARFYKIPSEAILIIYDELDFPPGVIRLKQGGSIQQKGVRSVQKHVTQPEALKYLRIGIGHPAAASLVSSYVLGTMSQDDRLLVQTAIDHVLDTMPTILSGDLQAAMNHLHALRIHH